MPQTDKEKDGILQDSDGCRGYPNLAAWAACCVPLGSHHIRDGGARRAKFRKKDEKYI